MAVTERSLTSRYVVLDRTAARCGQLSGQTAALALLIVFPFAIAAASKYDGTWHLGPNGKGLAEHYGFWAIFVTSPIILALTARLLRDFTRVIQEVDRYCSASAGELRTKVERLVGRHARSLSLRTRSAWILAFIVLVMTAWCALNVEKTINPVSTYGHDVFDSSAHPVGFVATKIYVFVVFGILYSVAVFVALHVTTSMISLFRFLFRYDLLKIDLFHRDNCGGTSRFGNINLLILGIYANFFAVIYAMYETHRTTYLAMIASLVACSALAVTQSVAAVYYIHKAVSQRKRESIDQVSARLSEGATKSTEDGEKFPSDLLTLRSHIIGVHSFPYAKGAAVAVNVIRFAPVALGLVNKYFR